MRLNSLKPAQGAKKEHHRVGRGGGSGTGKTCGRGHKGQTARSGYSRKVGFEGGQMPLQRRLPKFGFISSTAEFKDEVRLGDLNKVKAAKIDLVALKDANLVSENTTQVKVILHGKIDKAVNLVGIAATKGAAAAITKAGGTIT